MAESLNMAVFVNLQDGRYAAILNCNMAVYLNCNMAVFLKMEESLRWRKLEDGGILNMVVLFKF
jgi:hypothetical protein